LLAANKNQLKLTQIFLPFGIFLAFKTLKLKQQFIDVKYAIFIN